MSEGSKDDIPMQRQACREFAEQMGWQMGKEFEEKGVSGSKVSATKRDAIIDLKEAALKGEFQVLLVFMFDRLGRIDDETPFVLEWFVKNGIEVVVPPSPHKGKATAPARIFPPSALRRGCAVPGGAVR